MGKVWGSTKLLLSTPFIEVHELWIKPHSFCSVHMHQHKWNAFYSFNGTLNIHVFKNDYKLEDITTINTGDIATVRPGEYHFFKSGDMPVQALEIYYPEGLSEDIIRKTVGGRTYENNNIEKI